MKKSIVFATNNPNKIAEVSRQLGNQYHFLSLQDIGCLEELPETSNSLEGNARQKARFVYEHYGYPCFSEDTGLEVGALEGQPGVDTAHYAGPARNDQENMQKLLANLANHSDRSAQFRTVICLLLDGEEQLFTGICQGTIVAAPQGTEGFGYDPIFQPAGESLTFAQMGMDRKKQLSHRAKAVQALLAFLAQPTKE